MGGNLEFINSGEALAVLTPIIVFQGIFKLKEQFDPNFVEVV